MAARMAPRSSDSPLAYLNGQLIAAEDAQLPVWDRGVVQGATVTEMIRTFQRVPFRQEAHFARLRGSLDYLGVTLSETDEELAAVIERLIESRAAGLPPHADLGIVILVTPGAIPMYAGEVSTSKSPTICIHTFSLPFRQWAGKYQSGQALVVPSIRQIPSDILDPRFKYRSRLHWYLADREAHSVDPQAVALLQNAHGHLTETNSGNFFIVEQGRIRTARESDVLPGISQQFVKELAQVLEIPYEVGDISVECALQAEEAFVTSTTYCVLPVTRLNQQVIGNGTPGLVTQRLLNRWSKQVGLDIVHQANQDLEQP
ncbi:MAG: aminotransferase class IV [Planctomycetaceae bacterium]